MNKLGGEQNITPTDPKIEKNSLEIPEVPQFLIPYLTMEFEEDHYIPALREDPCWQVDHYKDYEHSPNLNIIAINTFKDKSFSFQAVSEEGHEELRAIRKLRRQGHRDEIEVLALLEKDEDNNWSKLSSDQNPNDQLL